MIQPFKIARYLFFFMLSIFTLSSCEDPELNALMDDYCDCISKSVHDSERRIQCIEKMDSIKEKYKNDTYKLKRVVDKTNDCHNQGL